MLKTYFLPKKLRPELRKIWGIPFFGKRNQVLRKFQEFIKKRKTKTIITVGDYCSLNLPSHIKIFDGKVKRKKIKKILKFSLSCQNPRGTIQKEVWLVIKRAIKNNENIFIDGEEDLLVIPAVLLARKNTLVVYGFQDKGVCVIEVSLKVKKIFKELLKKFRSN
ncbi:hypothetical protein AMJ49_00160 [Parcubacteria bacterium DG_74_2]|nr:MAG: hypothetical protein AMJ49_00160 [Parcubacteria bacterium DG_74_2]